ncbi:alpha/beta hydrolase family protein [Streptomyces sp. NBC_00239]|uniref:alpha/beta hydrolase family protein n=1 Tax=Streptomyces sp. NBC_00239 TaxID=2903640 RepID=UPI002E2A796A|nr:alpha/beta hydrolase [Streptomyces sp. NBC_00239]
MTRNRTAAAATLLALLLPFPLAAAGSAGAAVPAAATASAPAAASVFAADPAVGLTADRRQVALELPRPTGRFPVGQEVLHLTDRSRVDPWAGSGPRELMVTMRYPARPGSGTPARYLRTEEAHRLLADRDLDQVISPETLAGTAVYAREGARPRHGRYPLVVLSPGFGVPRATLTALAEELASRGYVVAAVDHAYEASAATFPGGRMLPCLACEKTEQTGDYRPVSDGRAKDVSFLLDRLTGHRPAWRHAELIDRRRIAMAGHSIGGASAAATMAVDRRVRAGVDMDGSLMTPVPATGLGGRPFLLLGAANTKPGDDVSWDRDWPLLDGWKRWITFAGSAHFTFTDFPALADQLGLPDPDAPLPGARSVELTRRYVTAFFDQHLKGRPQPILDGPVADAPEVGFHSP